MIAAFHDHLAQQWRTQATWVVERRDEVRKVVEGRAVKEVLLSIVLLVHHAVSFIVVRRLGLASAPFAHDAVQLFSNGGSRLSSVPSFRQKLIVMCMYVANMCSHCQFDCLCVESLRRRRSTYSPAVFPARMFSDGFSLRSRTTGIAQADLFRKLRNVFFVSALTNYNSSLS